MLTTDLIEHILAAVPGKTIGLLGDLFLDRYLDIDPARDEPSVETGKTAYQVTGVRSYPGALGTVLNNLAALGVGHILPISVIGDDGEGYELRQALAKLPAVDPGGLVMTGARRTPTYCKPMYGTEELNRLDIKNRTPTPAESEDAVLRKLDADWAAADAWIVLDQVSEEDCGVITARVRERLAELGERDPGRFVLADSRERIYRFRNVCLKPNAREIRSFKDAHPEQYVPTGSLYDEGDMKVVPAGRLVFVTNGENGIRVWNTDANTLDIVPAYPVTSPIDVCGAGDSCSAGITCAMTAGATAVQAAAFGNLVASITVQQLGTTGTASPGQVRQRCGEVQGAG